MLWTTVNALERHLFTTFITVLLLSFCAGLSWWIWLERFNRSVPDREELVELRGIASSPQSRNRSNSVWFHFQPSAPDVGGLTGPAKLRVSARDLAAVETALAEGPIPVVAWVVRAELGRGQRDEPPTVLHLQAGDQTLLPLVVGRDFRAEIAANARLSAWIAALGIAVSLIALIIHWVGRLRR